MSEQITQLGISGFTLFILLIIVRYFVKAMDTKDERIKEMTDQFRLVMENHIDHETKRWEETTRILCELLQAVKNLNGKHKNR